MGDDTGLIPRVVTAEPCVYCGSSGHFAGNCPYPHVTPESRRSKTELRRVSVRAHDDALRCDVVSGIGFAWRCTCGARGKITGDRRAALLGKTQHELRHQAEREAERRAALAGKREHEAGHQR